MSFRYGVPQQQDWNALSDAEFRRIVRTEFEAHYPAHLRYPPRRLRWSENRDWYLRMAEKGWIAPNWPADYGGMGLSVQKLLIFQEEAERWGIARYQDHGTLMLGPVLRFNMKAAAPLYAELADVVQAPGTQTGTGSVPERAGAFVAFMEDLMNRSGAPRRLRDCNVPEDSLPQLARDAMLQTRLLVNNPVELTENDALALYRAAF